MNSNMTQQRGAVLIIALMLLIVLTLIGLASMQNTSLEERMAGNMRSENVSFQASEGALREAEGWLATLIAEPAPHNGGATGVWVLDAPDPDLTDDFPWWRQRDDTWWAANGVAFGDSLYYTPSQSLTDQPRYVIEWRGKRQDSLNLGAGTADFGGQVFYQVTARGKDMSQQVESVVMSTFARRY